MNKRARRSTRPTRRIIYTEDQDEEVGSRQPKQPTKPLKPIPKKTVDTVDSSSLSGLEDSPSGSLAGEPDACLLEESLALPLRIINTAGRAHSVSYHTSHLPQDRHLLTSRDPPSSSLQASLLAWFDLVKGNREMPWRKEVVGIANWTEQQKGQRAYEVWVSEIMLQQTQVETVKSYYLRWMTRFPTIFDLAKADVEQVNECWQGLGYYSRASRLLSGAKKVVERFAGVLPEDPLVMEKEVDGIGPYSAGAIASIAYAKQVPMVDGNVHRVLSRITALYAPQAAKATTKFLWSIAAALVPQDRPGDFNQALMELGATVCKPREANCTSCPLSKWCRAYQEKQVLCVLEGGQQTHPSRLKRRVVDDEDIEDVCNLCQPLESLRASSGASSSDGHVLIYPMAKERKKPALREVAVSLVIWKESAPEDQMESSLENTPLSTGQAKALLIKRPEKGLLAGLWEFPSIDLAESNDSTADERQKKIERLLGKTVVGFTTAISSRTEGVSDGSKYQIQRSPVQLPDIEHVFSHLRVTYKSSVLLIHSPTPPTLQNPSLPDRPAASGQAIWSPCNDILTANLGNPHKKVWNAWLTHSDLSPSSIPSSSKPRKRKSSALNDPHA
ncbi:hypothetical protein PGT21_010045 [Puccinia graminis f. sp. tritici]|uniref:Adenine DNA glycosylase n=2 Tax=Puccinia graminis f. sp. tritici TaxID=56615 RepID=E3KYF5_PUCGT|nr:uncharacterized protein PGTG_15525 [Puccinia graminis f. sp. tritici CRL 75-36-700-3]EFP89346.2 hypothetical protein PGTG_15525 [Puccinia graminis f. sp. tritici CRL 75-36-700-3]KAA1103213.1 hypothetical protein PGT21_010045 [Puccinia graminis f. sp. tritici]